MEEQLDALLLQNQNNNQETNNNLEALIVQSQNNNSQSELEAVAKATLDVKNVIKKGNEDIKTIISSINKSIQDKEFPEFPAIPEFPEIKIPEYPSDIKINNAEEISSDIVEALNSLKSSLLEHSLILSQDNSKEASSRHLELIKAISSINFPDSIDYSEHLDKLLKELKKTIEYFPSSLVEDDRVKVKLSQEDIISLGKQMSVVVHPSGGGGGIDNAVYQQGVADTISAINNQTIDSVGIKNASDSRINPATEETLQAILDKPAGCFEVVGLKDSADARINPSTEEKQNTGNSIASNILTSTQQTTGAVAGLLRFPELLGEVNILPVGGFDFDWSNARLGGHKERLHVNKETGVDQINTGGEYYEVSSRDLDRGSGDVVIDIAAQNNDEEFRAITNIKMESFDIEASSDYGLVEVSVYAYYKTNGYQRIATHHFAISPNSGTWNPVLNKNDNDIAYNVHPVMEWNADDGRYGFIRARVIAGSFGSPNVFFRILLTTYSFKGKH